MEKREKRGISMMSAVGQALKHKKENQNVSNDSTMNHIARFVRDERDQETQLAMIAAASKALDISERNPRLSDREVVSQVMKEFDSIMSAIQ